MFILINGKNVRTRSRQKKGPGAPRQDGFTLIEILISFTLVSIGLLGAIAMQTKAINATSHGRRVTLAGTLAQDKLETLMSLPYDHADLQDTDNDGLLYFDNSLDHIDAEADYEEKQGLYNIYWNVLEDSPLNNTKTVRVIVTCPSDPIVVWDMALGRRANVSLDYIKTR